MAYANGFVPASALAPLDGQPGCFLRADAAAAWNAARAEVKRRTGIVLTVRGWNRTYAEQVLFYLQRHRLAKAGERVCCYWQERPYKFTGTAHAAPPGTSNHGWGLAVDVNDYGGVGNFSHPRRTATFPILAQYGWTDTEGRGAIREPWHLVWNPSSAWAVNNPIGTGGSVSIPTIPGRPAPIEEDDMFETSDRAQLQAVAKDAAESRKWGPRSVFVSIICDQTPNVPEYGSTGIYSDATGFVRTSDGLGSRAELDAWVAIAGVLGFYVEERHVDRNGWIMAHRFARPEHTNEKG